MTLPAQKDVSLASKCSTIFRNSSNNNQENQNIKVKTNNPNTLKKKSEDKSDKKRKQKQLRHLNETPEQREKRLEKQREYKSSRTPEQKEAYKLKNALYTRRYRQEQLEAAQTPEEKEALLQKRKDYSRNYREKVKSLAKTPEEKEALRLKLVIQKRRSVTKLRNLPGRDCKGQLCKPEEIEDRRLKRINDDEETSLLALKKRWQATEKMREYRRKNQNKTTIGRRTALVPVDEQNTRKRIKEEIAPNLPIAVEVIKVEEEILQEINIKTIPYLPLPSCNWYGESSENSRPTGATKYHLDLPRNHSTKIKRRKTTIETSLNCMRELIDVTAKGDSYAIFGKHIAQKLTNSKRSEDEVNIAKILIDNVLQSLAIDANCVQVLKNEFIMESPS